MAPTLQDLLCGLSRPSPQAASPPGRGGVRSSLFRNVSASPSDQGAALSWPHLGPGPSLSPGSSDDPKQQLEGVY